MDDRHNNGRRSADSWATKVGGIVILLGTVYSVAAWGIPLAGLPKRVEQLEQEQPALLYMACLSFRDSHPNQMPAVCEQAISRPPR